MFDDQDAEKREQDRLLRTMNKAGSRPKSASFAPQPNRASWNVNLNPGVRYNHAAAGGSSIGRKNDQAEAIRALRDQILLEEAKQESTTPRGGVEAPSPRDPPTTHSPTHAPREHIPRSESLEDQAELSAAGAFNESREMARINRWTRGSSTDKSGGGGGVSGGASVGGVYEKPIPAVLMRAGAIEDSLKEETAAAPSMRENEEYTQGVSKFTLSVTIAAKAVRAQNGEALAKSCYAAVTLAKTLASLAKDDEQISSWARALEGTTNMLRGRVDSGSTGHEFYSEISNALGHLYLAVVALS